MNFYGRCLLFNFLFTLFLGHLTAAAESVIHVRDYGIKPNTRQNIEPVLRKILRERVQGDPVKIVFEVGRYDFWPRHEQEALFVASIGVDLTGKKNVTLDGGGASFIFHGRMMPFRLERSENVLLRNFSIDWDRTFISQGEVLEVGDNHLDLRIDSREYPYEIDGDTIFFVGEGWRSPITPNFNNLFDGKTKDIVYQTRDNPLGDLPKATVTALGPDSVRFHFKPKFQAEKGAYVAMFHGAYITDGILILHAKDIFLEQITIYHTLSCGVSGYRSENISLKGVSIVANEAKGRVFSTVADATHFNGCKGTIIIDGTTISGAGDDFTNIHGMYAPVLELGDSTSVVVAPNGRYIGFDPGETAWVVDTAAMQRVNTFTVRSQHTLWKDGKIVGYRVVFDKPYGKHIKVGDLLENKERNPDLYIRNCRILKKNRARGALITTAGKVVIENNYFNTAGAAILIEGDIELWFESGATTDVLIRNNVFDNCYTSGNNIVDKPWGWGEGVISITPSVLPKNTASPAYHRNIRIENNHFRHYDYQVLYARAVQGLTFTGNQLTYTTDYVPFYRKANLVLDGCREVFIKDNQLDKAFPGRNIQLFHMDKKDVKQEGKSRWQVEVR
jgi:hypothetical protein